MKTVAVIFFSDNALAFVRRLKNRLETDADYKVSVFSSRDTEDTTRIQGVSEFIGENFGKYDAFVFVGSLGICVRTIAPCIGDKYSDPAVLNCDEAGAFVQPVLSGHVGGGNALAERVGRLTGAVPVITTSSDVQGIWNLDILGREKGWRMEFFSGIAAESCAGAMSLFVNHEPTLLLLETRDELTDHLERTRPSFVTIVYNERDIDFSAYKLFLAVTPRILSSPVPSFFYRPGVLCAGLGSEKDIDPETFCTSFFDEVKSRGFSPLALKALGTAEFKKEEKAFVRASQELGVPLHGFAAEVLERVENVPNPSETVYRRVGVRSVAEASSAILAGEPRWVVEKQKIVLPGFAPDSPRNYTFALSVDAHAVRRGRIVIVGAGPGDPELVTVKGKNCLETADLILYAGSLVPEKLTRYARPGAVVRSSASMALEEQLSLMGEFYRKGGLVVRLHTGDPSIYGAIQEQMNWFESKGMDYSIVPGVSSFQAAAARLKSQLTIPEQVQTIILTRYNGRTPVPEKEALRELARSRATMCLFLSAEWSEEVQRELQAHYPPSTPVAVCYRLTWDEEEIRRGTLSELSALVRQSGKIRTVLIVVGDALEAGQQRSRLYDPAWSHAFRPASKKKVGDAQ